MKAQSDFDDVGDFHEKFGLPTVTHEGPFPRPVPKDLMDFRVGFIEEELRELKEGIEAGDHARIFDALLDINYVSHGLAHLMGYPWEDGWNLVQTANMAKERATRADQSERGGAWDVIKPEGWTPPAIDSLLAGYKFPRPALVRRCTICHQGIFDPLECYTLNNTPGHKQFAHYPCAEKEGFK